MARIGQLLRLSPRRLWRLSIQAARVARRRGLVALWHKLRTYDLEAAALYDRWVGRFGTLGRQERAALAARVGRLADSPLISVVMPVYDPDPALLEAAVASVRAQVYANWELCLADDASPDPAIRPLIERLAAEDPRIRVAFRERNGHIAAATNTALGLARGLFVAFLDQDDLLPEAALASVALALAHAPDTDLLYSDEDKIDRGGRRYDPDFKPAWDPDLILGQNYVNHLCVARRTLIERAGGLRDGFPGAQDHDLVLRLSRASAPERIRHLALVLYHWRATPGSTADDPDAKPAAAEARRRAVEDHLGVVAPGARALTDPATGAVHVVWPLPAPAPAVTVIVPTRDRLDLLEPCVAGVLERTDYPEIRLVVVDNGSAERATLAFLEALVERDPRVAVIRDRRPFNFAALNNGAVAASRTPLVCLLNNDVEPLTPDWLDHLARQATRPEVGIAGALLAYPDGTIQHAGIVCGIGGVAGHLYKRLPLGDPGPFARLALPRNVAAVTAACLMARRAVYEEVGGMDASGLAVDFNDVDFCLRVRAAGYRVILEPRARLVHHESPSRGLDLRRADRPRARAEAETMARRWAAWLAADPFHNPNLSLESERLVPAFPPRVALPGRDGAPPPGHAVGRLTSPGGPSTARP